MIALGARIDRLHTAVAGLMLFAAAASAQTLPVYYAAPGTSRINVTVMNENKLVDLVGVKLDVPVVLPTFVKEFLPDSPVDIPAGETAIVTASLDLFPIASGTSGEMDLILSGENLSPRTRPVILTADSVAPTISISSPSAGASISGLVSITATLSDALSGIDGKRIFIVSDGETYSISLDLGLAKDTSLTYAIALQRIGAQTITVIVYDKAGNIATASVNVVCTVLARIDKLVRGVDGTTLYASIANHIFRVRTDGSLRPVWSPMSVWTNQSAYRIVDFNIVPSSTGGDVFGVVVAFQGNGPYTLITVDPSSSLVEGADVQAPFSNLLVSSAGNQFMFVSSDPSRGLVRRQGARSSLADYVLGIPPASEIKIAMVGTARLAVAARTGDSIVVYEDDLSNNTVRKIVTARLSGSDPKPSMKRIAYDPLTGVYTITLSNQSAIRIGVGGASEVISGLVDVEFHSGLSSTLFVRQDGFANLFLSRFVGSLSEDMAALAPTAAFEANVVIDTGDNFRGATLVGGGLQRTFFSVPLAGLGPLSKEGLAPPVIRFVHPDPGQNLSQGVRVEIAVDRGSVVQSQFFIRQSDRPISDRQPISSLGTSLATSWNTPSSPDGRYLLEAVVTDSFGNRTTAQQVVTVDNTAPRIEVASANKIVEVVGSSVQRSDAITYQISEPCFIQVEIPMPQLSVSPVKLVQPDLSIPGAEKRLFWDERDLEGKGVPDGIYPVRLIATDPAGNRADTTLTIRVSGERVFVTKRSTGRYALPVKIGQEIRILNSVGQEVRRTTATDSIFVWEGRDQFLSLLDLGSYVVMIDTRTYPVILETDEQAPIISSTIPVAFELDESRGDSVQGSYSTNEYATSIRYLLVAQDGTAEDEEHRPGSRAFNGFSFYLPPTANRQDKLVVKTTVGDSQLITPGRYTAIISALDAAGNEGSKTVDVLIRGKIQILHARVFPTYPNAVTPDFNFVDDVLQVDFEATGQTPYRTEISDRSGRAIASIRGTSDFGNNRLFWNMIDSGSRQIVQDGEYFARVFLIDASDSILASSESLLFRVSGSVPLPSSTNSSVKAAPSPFSPDGDGVEDQTSISLVSSFADVYDSKIITATISNASGSIIRVLSKSKVTSLTWDGTDNIGNAVPDGKYQITLRVDIFVSGTAYWIRFDTVSVAVIRTSERFDIEGFHITPAVLIANSSQDAERHATIQASSTREAYFSSVIRDAAGRVRRTIAEDAFYPKGLLAFSWDGLDLLGRVIPNGRYTFLLDGTSTRGTASRSGTITKLDRSPEAEISNLLDGFILSGGVDLSGFAAARPGEFSRYELNIEQTDTSGASHFVTQLPVADASTAVIGTALGRWDTTKFKNGEYVLRLLSYAANGAYATDTVRVQLRNAQIFPVANTDTISFTATGSELRKIASAEGRWGRLTWDSTAQKRLIIEDNGISIIDSKGARIGTLATGRGVFAPAWAPSDTVYFSSGEDLTSVYRINANGSGYSKLTLPVTVPVVGDVSSDGKRLLISAVTAPGNADIYLVNLAQSPLTITKLTTDPHMDVEPTFLSDNEVVFVSNRSGAYELWKHTISSATEQRLTTNGGTKTDPDVSGNEVIFVEY